MEPHQTEQDTTRLWNEREAARYLNVSVEFLQQDRFGKKRIPYIKIGRAVRYAPADVLAFQESCRVKARA